jgi:UDP-glucose 4-epimerase
MITDVVFGGAGMIGSHICKTLLKLGHKVIAVDDLSAGKIEWLPIEDKNMHFIHCDLLDYDSLLLQMKNYDVEDNNLILWNMAANSDIQIGSSDPHIDFKNTLGTTITSIRFIQQFNVKQFIFASTSAVYGDHGDTFLREDERTYIPISNYGVMKLASENLLSIFASSRMQCRIRIFRFPNVVGLPLSHGLIHDMFYKMIQQPKYIEILGNGKQSKPYIHVSDLISAMVYLNEKGSNFEVYNIGPTGENVNVSFIVEKMAHIFAPNSKLEYGESERGWIGDVPKYFFNTDKSKQVGLPPLPTSEQAILKVIEELRNGI